MRCTFAYAGKCRKGFYGNGTKCAKCLECDPNAIDSGCPEGSSTINTCTCKAGFYGNGQLCTHCRKCSAHGYCSSCPTGSSVINQCTCGVGYFSQDGFCDAGYVLPAQAAGVRVLLVAAVFDPTEITDVQSKLLATRAFAAVDAFDASAKTPTLSDLKPYTAVLVFNNVKFASPSALGDVLADYWDGGGAVVLAMSAVGDSYSQASDSWYTNLQGRFGTAASGRPALLPRTTRGSPSLAHLATTAPPLIMRPPLATAEKELMVATPAMSGLCGSATLPSESGAPVAAVSVAALLWRR